MVSWELDVSNQRFFNQNSFDEGFPYDNPGLARLSYVNIFQDCRSQWSTLRYVEQDVLS